jgi:hypothetical protein
MGLNNFSKKGVYMNKKNRAIGLAILILSCTTFFTCKLSTEDLAKQVQEHIVETWKENGVDLTIAKDLLLVKRSDNEYSGLITLFAEGETEQVTVNVIYDGKSFSWKIDRF